MTYAEIHAALKERGTQIGDYQQAELVSKAPPALQGHISEGFCAGAAVDWLRCVLQGAAASHRPDVTMASVAYLAQQPVQREKFLADFKSKVKKLEDDSVRTMNQDIRALNERAQQIIEMKVKAAGASLTQAQYDQLVEDVQTALSGRTKAIQDEARLKKDKFAAALSQDSTFERFWTHSSKTLDEKLTQKLGAQKYSNLTVAGSSKPTFYGPPNGAVALIDTVLKDTKLSSGNGVLLGIYPPSDAGGHAIAIRRLNNGEYHLFDPNFGVFGFKFENVRWAFAFLFLKGYPTLNSGTKDNKAYQIEGTVRGEYVIFQGSQLSPPAVTRVGTAGETAALHALGNA
jgi:virulence surface antigen